MNMHTHTHRYSTSVQYLISYVAGLWVTFERTTFWKKLAKPLSVARRVIISNYTLPWSSVTVPPKGWGGGLVLKLAVIFDHKIDQSTVCKFRGYNARWRYNKSHHLYFR